VSGLSGDMRQILHAAAAGHDQARLALAIYVHRLRQAIGAMAVTLGGVDALVFTAGVGENSAPVRAQACAGLACFGLVLDPQRNESIRPDGRIGADDSPGQVLVIHTREDLVILRETRRLLE
jgi:acetate kinase